MDHLETELKFFVADFGALRERLRKLGASITAARTFEHNMRYETEGDRLFKRKCLLRLRKDRQTTLTFKSPPPEADKRFKVYRELEVQVSDFDTMDAILKALGFFRRQVYEKWRETWQLSDAVLCLDEMPYGSFLEIEGQPDAILQIVCDLGLAWEQRILANYLGMFATFQEKEGWNFADVTFDNFSGVLFSFDRYRHLFEAGKDGR
jgi:adenylate cyclase class 2